MGFFVGFFFFTNFCNESAYWKKKYLKMHVINFKIINVPYSNVLKYLNFFSKILCYLIFFIWTEMWNDNVYEIWHLHNFFLLRTIWTFNDGGGFMVYSQPELQQHVWISLLQHSQNLVHLHLLRKYPVLINAICLFSSPEAKVHCHCCCRKRFTFSSSSQEPARPISTKLDTKHPWLKEIWVRSNEGHRCFPTGDNNKITEIHLWNLKIF